MLPTKLKCISIFVLSAASFSFGFYLSSQHYNLKLERLENQLAEQTISDLGIKEEKEQQYFSGVINAQNNFDLSTASIYNSFSTYLASSFNDTSNRLSVSTEDTSGKHLSGHSKDSRQTASETGCECNGSDRAELQRIRKLYEKELVNSRDCDLKTAQLNALIDIVKTISSN